MKISLITLLLTFSFVANADIAPGKYEIEKIQCNKSGKILKLGGKFMVYKIDLDVTDKTWEMTAKAQSGSWAPFKLNCTQVNKGTITYTSANTFEGELPNVSVKCNTDMWTRILKKKLFGVEEFGEFTYEQNGNSLKIYNTNTITKYSCDNTGDYPVYYYTKK